MKDNKTMIMWIMDLSCKTEE